MYPEDGLQSLKNFLMSGALMFHTESKESFLMFSPMYDYSACSFLSVQLKVINKVN